MIFFYVMLLLTDLVPGKINYKSRSARSKGCRCCFSSPGSKSSLKKWCALTLNNGFPTTSNPGDFLLKDYNGGTLGSGTFYAFNAK